ncbi:hypothetical protein IRJ41_010892 [Triplophysa rosa]|uniref:Uncharacterized protein n=1 Tax=Triplophysa rosa TaxID=992332 RepID=A0A9W7X5R1_TRIRA|nr:hypothetical protein IRJ41_010892 [Triplophysa rosa]
MTHLATGRASESEEDTEGRQHRVRMSGEHPGFPQYRRIVARERSQSISASSFVRRGIRQRPYRFSSALQIGWRFAAVNQAANHTGRSNLSKGGAGGQTLAGDQDFTTNQTRRTATSPSAPSASRQRC